MIVVVEGPSAAGKTTWCQQHAERWLPEPGRWPMDQVLGYQVDRWREAVDADARDEVVVLDGDPFKLYFTWAAHRLGVASQEAWHEAVERFRLLFATGDCGLADLVLYADPGEPELRRRKASDRTRSRRNFERNTAFRPYFRLWYETVSELDPGRVVWQHPSDGLAPHLLAIGRRASRSDPQLLERLLAHLPAHARDDEDDDIEPPESPMQRCVDRDDIDGLLDLVSLGQIAVAWNRYSATPEPKSDYHPDWWAIELLMSSALFERSDLHRDLLLELLEHATDETLGAVAAGPLEDFLSDDEDDLRWIESHAATNPRLRSALTGVWAASYVSEATMLRLDAAAGEPLPRPLPRSELPQEFRDVEAAGERLGNLVAGGMAAYALLQNPTEEQRAAAEAYLAAVRAAADRPQA